MSVPRFRMFAGPNGSGKSTLFESFSKNYNTGFFINADFIEKELATKGYIDLNDFELTLNQSDLDLFLKTDVAKSLVKKSLDTGNAINFEIINNVIVDKAKDTHSYEGALISSFLKTKLQEKKLDFSFETVMSHPSKVQSIIEAKENGYKTYLYFICIDDPEINVSRVQNRIQKGGHPVDDEKIKARYYRALQNLMPAIEVSDKTYLFDNSSDELMLIGEIFEQKLTLKVESKCFPNWFIEFVLKHYAA